MHSRRVAGGFTLVELLVVIFIIALLVGILVPSLGKAKESARRTACAANLKQIGIAIRMYLGENNDALPVASEYGPPPEWDDSVGPYRPSIATVLKPYLSKEVSAQDAVFHCPSDIGGKTRREGELEGLSFYETDSCSYAYNRFLSGQRMYEIVRNPRVIRYFGSQVTEEEIWIMRDMVAFHGKPGTPGASNYLYVDGHVGDLSR